MTNIPFAIVVCVYVECQSADRRFTLFGVTMLRCVTMQGVADWLIATERLRRALLASVALSSHYCVTYNVKGTVPGVYTAGNCHNVVLAFPLVGARSI